MILDDTNRLCEGKLNPFKNMPFMKRGQLKNRSENTLQTRINKRECAVSGIPYIWFITSKKTQSQRIHLALKNTVSKALIQEMSVEQVMERFDHPEAECKLPDAMLVDVDHEELLDKLKYAMIPICRLICKIEQETKDEFHHVEYGDDYLSNVKSLDAFIDQVKAGSLPNSIAPCFKMRIQNHTLIITPKTTLNITWAQESRIFFEKISAQRVFINMKEIALLDASGLLAIGSLANHLTDSGGILALMDINFKVRTFLEAAKEAFPHSVVSRLRFLKGNEV